MRNRILLIIVLLCGVSMAGNAQKYKTAAGVRLESDRFGLTIQQKLHESGTLEGIVAVGAREYSGTVLYEKHYKLLGERFNYYIGGGGHVGNLKDNGVFTGVDAILGIEYKVNGLPFLLSADVKPAVHINHEDWVQLSSGVSVRYVLVKEKKKKKSIWPFGNRDEGKSQKKSKNRKEEKKPGLFDIFKKQED
ncbi:hypothetical protein CLV24_103105 [Pontibacter ummariensis]|uniref:Outer membrane protein beta-barrel domain-containing protein n=1 Tax=Pontibacter ummariensis TaxID=1610492 RepID=A0A239CTL1_9BACT|nr:hypothetical protein [Pontibacter ummariensis]PRY14868.1 hypothetical protein CLV24_103105 [Pontibacter ummariensis]SNS22703.1 hypothetical protein SAMN06296052_103208 [Pontibacter ummariensis]